MPGKYEIGFTANGCGVSRLVVMACGFVIDSLALEDRQCVQCLHYGAALFVVDGYMDDPPADCVLCRFDATGQKQRIGFADRGFVERKPRVVRVHHVTFHGDREGYQLRLNSHVRTGKGNRKRFFGLVL